MQCYRHRPRDPLGHRFRLIFGLGFEDLVFEDLGFEGRSFEHRGFDDRSFDDRSFDNRDGAILPPVQPGLQPFWFAQRDGLDAETGEFPFGRRPESRLFGRKLRWDANVQSRLGRF